MILWSAQILMHFFDSYWFCVNPSAKTFMKQIKSVVTEKDQLQKRHNLILKALFGMFVLARFLCNEKIPQLLNHLIRDNFLNVFECDFD